MFDSSAEATPNDFTPSSHGKKFVYITKILVIIHQISKKIQIYSCKYLSLCYEKNINCFFLKIVFDSLVELLSTTSLLLALVKNILTRGRVKIEFGYLKISLKTYIIVKNTH